VIRTGNAFGSLAQNPTESGTGIPAERLWQHLTGGHHYFRGNPAEQNRFLTVVTANNLGVNAVVEELMRAAGHAAEDVGPYYCRNCVEEIITDRIREWWNGKKEAGVLPGALPMRHNQSQLLLIIS
jgi:hypothetical protein